MDLDSSSAPAKQCSIKSSMGVPNRGVFKANSCFDYYSLRAVYTGQDSRQGVHVHDACTQVLKKGLGHLPGGVVALATKARSIKPMIVLDSRQATAADVDIPKQLVDLPRLGLVALGRLLRDCGGNPGPNRNRKESACTALSSEGLQ